MEKKTKAVKKEVTKLIVVEKKSVGVAPVRKDKASLISYLLMFKIEGHTTYRTSLFKDKEAFDLYLRNQPNHPKVTDRKWFKIDCITGTITEEK